MENQRGNVNKSLVVISGKFDDVGTGEETEITAQLTIAPDGGWGWVVFVCSFLVVAITDGVVLAYGALLSNISKDLQVTRAEAALINSMQMATYLLTGPVASALINKLGFRTVGMMGSIMCSLAILCTYLSTNYVSVLILYGFITGVGCSLTFLSSALIVGFYFVKLRSIVLPLASCGTSFGIMVMNEVHGVTVSRAGWRSTMLLQAGLFGFAYYLCLTYRPLPSLTIITEDEGSPTRTVTYLPTMETNAAATASRGSIKVSAAERALKAVSNAYFPTAASIIGSTQSPNTLAGQGGSTQPSRITFKSTTALKDSQIKQMQSIFSTRNVRDTKQPIEITIETEEDTRGKSCCGRLCSWDSHHKEVRPMYRDDVFYRGRIEKLPAYQKSVKNMPENLQEAGLQYQMEVTRAAAVDELKDKRFCSMSLRRTLATMLNFQLLSKPSFFLFCFSGLLTNSGSLVPFIFLQVRGEDKGMDPNSCKSFITVLSLANLLGRGLAVVLTLKIQSIYVFTATLAISGISTIASSVSYSVAYQYFYSFMYGLNIAGVSCLRSLVIVDGYGLENLTNAFGIVLLFNGIAALYCSPLAAYLARAHGYETAFYVAGGFMILASVTVGVSACLRVWEKNKEKSTQGTTIVPVQSQK